MVPPTGENFVKFPFRALSGRLVCLAASVKREGDCDGCDTCGWHSVCSSAWY